jgi:uncharacterized protein
MPIFDLTEKSSALLGRVVAVDTRRVTINVEPARLPHARVGKLVAIRTSNPVEEWLIAMVDRVQRALAEPDRKEKDAKEGTSSSAATPLEREINSVVVVLVGSVCARKGTKTNVFSRSFIDVPDIDAWCYALEDKELQRFMGLLSKEAASTQALELGVYTLDPKATAYVDGDKFFQRHAALLGSTGSGKSWTVATILERAKELPSANVVVFDLHGEYSSLSYASHLRIAGPDDIGKTDSTLLYLPYWLLNSEELQAMFIDRSEFSAHNQVLVFQDQVLASKRRKLEAIKKNDVISALTINAPVPFGMDEVMAALKELNEEKEQGERGMKQGKFFGQFSRLLVRMGAKLGDKRYGFMFQGPPDLDKYEALHGIASQLMDWTGKDHRIKVIDFSEVPADVLSVIVGLVARLIYQVQFWTPQASRVPVALVCDEAHLYLPQRSETDAPERRALENFERIAKEGRKYGVALLVVSQRPSDVSDTILSQCNNFVALRLTNGDDQSKVKRLMPDSLEGFMDMLPVLDIGEALIVGDAVLLPSRVRITAPSENDRPRSATIEFWSEWSKTGRKPALVQAVENMRRQSRRSS